MFTSQKTKVRARVKVDVLKKISDNRYVIEEEIQEKDVEVLEKVETFLFVLVKDAKIELETIQPRGCCSLDHFYSIKQPKKVWISVTDVVEL
jgi:hypothetical protein